MNPPPPILPAEGSTTASANATATPASTAFPPRFRISTPASEPSCSSVATMPCDARTACLGQSDESTECGRYSAAAWARATVAQAKQIVRTQASCFAHLPDAGGIFIRPQTLRDSRSEVKKLRRGDHPRDVGKRFKPKRQKSLAPPGRPGLRLEFASARTAERHAPKDSVHSIPIAM